MDWSAVSAIAEWVGLALILVSLVYVARQIHQNTETVEAATELEMARAWSNFHARVAHSPDMADIWERGHISPESLEPTEKRRFIWIVAEYLFLVEGMHRQYSSGFLSNESWGQHRAAVAGLLMNPLLSRWWDTNVSPFSNKFRQEIEAARKELPADAVWTYTSIADI